MDVKTAVPKPDSDTQKKMQEMGVTFGKELGGMVLITLPAGWYFRCESGVKRVYDQYGNVKISRQDGKRSS